MDNLPDHILIDIFKYLNKRDLCKNICFVCKKWNSLSYESKLWKSFTLLNIKNPPWCKFHILTPIQTFNLIEKRFSITLQHIDISKLCFSFNILQILFKNCIKIKSLIINFKYFMLNNNDFGKLEDYIQTEEQIPSTIEYLYLKNVCDQKLRFKIIQTKAKYNSFELEIIKLIKLLLNRNKFSLKYLGFKCVDPTIITQDCLQLILNVEILLLNNIYDTDSVLEECSVLTNLRAIELCKCKAFDGNGLQDLFDLSSDNLLETIQIGKSIKLSQSELDEIIWSKIENLKELYLDSNDLCQLSANINETNNCFNEFKTLEYLALNNYEFNEKQNYFPYLVKNNTNLRTFILRPLILSDNSNDWLSTSKRFLLHLEKFFTFEYNIEYLDLIGFTILDANYLVSIIDQLKNLKYFYFGHGKSFLNTNKSSSTRLNIDLINLKLADNNKNLIEYGIFYKETDIDITTTTTVAKASIDKLFENCVNLKKIYLLNKNKKYENLLKDKILNFEINHNDFQLVICNGLDELVSSSSSFHQKLVVDHAIPAIKPPKLDFHSKFSKVTD